MNIISWVEFWIAYTEFMRHGETAKSDDKLHYILINARHYNANAPAAAENHKYSLNTKRAMMMHALIQRQIANARF